jgi:hypothetical protein
MADRDARSSAAETRRRELGARPDDCVASGAARGGPGLRRSHLGVAVSQTPDGLTEAFLRVGSKKPQVVARPRRALLGLGAASPLSDRHSERGPGFRRRLCATATGESARPASNCATGFAIAEGQSYQGSRASRAGSV